jgi:hypothetical protein
MAGSRRTSPGCRERQPCAELREQRGAGSPLQDHGPDLGGERRGSWKWAVRLSPSFALIISYDAVSLFRPLSVPLESSVCLSASHIRHGIADIRF